MKKTCKSKTFQKGDDYQKPFEFFMTQVQCDDINEPDEMERLDARYIITITKVEEDEEQAKV